MRPSKSSVDIVKLESFISKFDGFTTWPGKKQVDYFSYFLTRILRHDAVTAKSLEECFDALRLRKYTRIANYLSEDANKRREGRYIKAKGKGYQLERGTLNELQKEIEHEPRRTQASQSLLDLVSKIKDPQQKLFLEEARKCFQVEAYRAAIIMSWLLTIDHLQRHVFSNSTQLSDFNNELAKNPDKRVKCISAYDNFSDLKEEKLIELLRAAKIISNDVRKILNEKLGIRNSAAHPSTVVFSSHKTTEFVVDLVENVLLKY